jgi:hypothetical protein
MKILGAGLSRTGTLSLHSALQVLGFSSLHFDTMRLNNVIDGSDTQPNFRRYDDVDAVIDLPVAYFYEELMLAYPDSKCILTVRDPDKWWRSISRHFNEHHPVILPGLSGIKQHVKAGIRDWLHISGRHEARDLNLFRIHMRNLVYGSVVAHEYLYKKKYREHQQRVMHTVPAERLLVMDIASGDGWEQLCPFLGVPIPSVPFPHENRSHPYCAGSQFPGV